MLLSIDFIQENFDCVYKDGDRLPKHLTDLINPIKQRKMKNYPGVMSLGWVGALPNCHVNQPLLFEFLSDTNAEIIIGEKFFKIPIIDVPSYRIAAFLGSEKYGFVALEPYYEGGDFVAKGIKHSCFSRYMSLPVEIAETYYSRIAGLEVWGAELGDAVLSRGMPSVITKWQSVHDYADKSLGREVRDSLQSLRRKVRSEVDVINDFSVVLDPVSLGVSQGDRASLMIQEGVEGGKVFYLRNMDFKNLRVVRNLKSLYDNYSVFRLSGNDGCDFDFSLYLE